jgi:hypothetical protein
LKTHRPCLDLNKSPHNRWAKKGVGLKQNVQMTQLKKTLMNFQK